MEYSLGSRAAVGQPVTSGHATTRSPCLKGCASCLPPCRLEVGYQTCLMEMERNRSCPLEATYQTYYQDRHPPSPSACQLASARRPPKVGCLNWPRRQRLERIMAPSAGCPLEAVRRSRKGPQPHLRVRVGCPLEAVRRSKKSDPKEIQIH